eukprot:c52136_g1_i1.p1 GENE.c52136_g1_i1~~c52136_g1_i1.p1  ORF type:complete len:235 (+),score=36.02 c52136_g1_i1:41-745(+)
MAASRNEDAVLHEGVIPAGVVPNQRFDVLLPDGERIPVRCPSDRRGGDRFVLRPFRVVIPAGVKKGKPFNVEANGRVFPIVRPKNKKCGESVIIRVPEFPDDRARVVQQQQDKDDELLIIPQTYSVPAEISEQATMLPDDIEIPSEMICPITQEIMLDPVIAIDGHSYEHQAMKSWLSNHNTSPKTNEQLISKILIPNIALRSRIHSFIESYAAIMQSVSENEHEASAPALCID